MKKIPLRAVATFANVALLGGPVLAQRTSQTVNLVKVDVKTLATGYRTSKVVGSTVVNEANETVGKIDDLIVTREVPFAVLSVGSFRLRDKAMVLPGASKDALKALPEFKYASC